MVCCFAVTHFSACKHNQLLKVGCTLGCDGFCESQGSLTATHETMVTTRFRFHCVSCIKAEAAHDRAQRDASYAEARRAIESRTTHIQDEKLREKIQFDMIHNVRARDGWALARAAKVFDKRIEEATDAERWTLEYAEGIMKFYYSNSGDQQQAQNDLHSLADLIPPFVNVVNQKRWYSNYIPSSGGSDSQASNNDVPCGQNVGQAQSATPQGEGMSTAEAATDQSMGGLNTSTTEQSQNKESFLNDGRQLLQPSTTAQPVQKNSSTGGFMLSQSVPACRSESESALPLGDSMLRPALPMSPALSAAPSSPLVPTEEPEDFQAPISPASIGSPRDICRV